MGDVLPRRIHGVESEFAPVAAGTDGNFEQLNHHEIGDCLSRYAEDYPASSNTLAGYFMQNGARVYRDAGDHLEVTTAEEVSFEATTAAIRASWRIAEQVVAYSKRTSVSGEPIRLYHRTIDDVGTTSGYHENFATRRREGDVERLYRAVALERATSNILCGAGYVDTEGRFLLGQKATTVEHGFSSGSTKGKGVISLRDEPHAERATFRRLPVTSGDATMSPWATRMSLAKSSLALRLDEYDVNVGEYQPWDLAVAMRSTGKEEGWHSFGAIGGSRYTAWDVQRGLVAACRRLSDEVVLPDEELWALDEWDKALADFKQDPELLKDRVDWVMKGILLRRQRERHGLAWSSPEIRGLDREWHNVASDGIARKLEQSVWAPYMPAESLIQDRQHNAPVDTRAAIRGKVVRAFRDGAVVEWDSVKIGNRSIPLPDPMDTSHQEVERLIEKRIATTPTL